MIHGVTRKNNRNVESNGIVYDDLHDKSIIDKIFSTDLREKLEGLKFFKESLENGSIEHIYSNNHFDILCELILITNENKEIDNITSIDLLLSDHDLTRFRGNIEINMFGDKSSFKEDELMNDIVKYSRIVVLKIAEELPRYHHHLFDSGIMLTVIKSIEQDWAFRIIHCLKKEDIISLSSYYNQNHTAESFLEVMIDKIRYSKTNEKEFSNILRFLNILIGYGTVFPTGFLTDVLSDIYYCLFQSYNEDIYSLITELIEKCPDVSNDILFGLRFSNNEFPMALVYQFSSSSYIQRKYFLRILNVLSRSGKLSGMFMFSFLDKWFMDTENRRLENHIFDIITSLLSNNGSLVLNFCMSSDKSLCFHIFDNISKKSIDLASSKFVHLFKVLLSTLLESNIDLVDSPLNINIEEVLADALLLGKDDIVDDVCDIILLVLQSKILTDTVLGKSVRSLCTNYSEILYDIGSSKIDHLNEIVRQI